MKRFGWMLLSVVLLCSCSASNEYAEEVIGLYEDALENFKDAESCEELEQLNRDLRKSHDQLEKDYQESREEMTKAIGLYDEEVYSLYLEMLSAESRAQFVFQKKVQELSKKK